MRCTVSVMYCYKQRGTLNTATRDVIDWLLVPTPTRLSYIPKHPNNPFDYTLRYTCNPQSETAAIAYRMTSTGEL